MRTKVNRAFQNDDYRNASFQNGKFKRGVQLTLGIGSF